MKKNGITEFEGAANFVNANSLTVTGADGVLMDTINFTNAILATGAVIRTLPGVPIGKRITGYEEVVLATEMPKSLVIIGAGPIGVEFACVAASFGSQVTIVEYQDRILPLEDADSSAEMAKALKKLGISIVTSARVTSASETAQSATVSFSVVDEEKTLEAEHVMVSVGFAPFVEGYGLENTGIELSPNQAIAVDSQLRTSVPHIFAIGDVTAKLSLAHVAEAQGILAAESIRMWKSSHLTALRGATFIPLNRRSLTF
jgi:dihydrolipoamide dehydrogenase